MIDYESSSTPKILDIMSFIYLQLIILLLVMMKSLSFTLALRMLHLRSLENRITIQNHWISEGISMVHRFFGCFLMEELLSIWCHTPCLRSLADLIRSWSKLIWRSMVLVEENQLCQTCCFHGAHRRKQNSSYDIYCGWGARSTKKIGGGRGHMLTTKIGRSLTRGKTGQTALLNRSDQF